METGELDHIEDVLCQMRTGQWFGWKNLNGNDNNKVYENLIIHDPELQSSENKALHGIWSTEKPTKEFLESELVRMEQARKDAIQTDIDTKSSAKAKLEALGLTSKEVKSVFGI